MHALNMRIKEWYEERLSRQLEKYQLFLTGSSVMKPEFVSCATAMFFLLNHGTYCGGLSGGSYSLLCNTGDISVFRQAAY